MSSEPPAPSRRRLIGYVRASAVGTNSDTQFAALEAAGCQTIHREIQTGSSRVRPVLLRLLRELGPGDGLVVTNLDRLAWSVGHLTSVIADLQERRAFFRSLDDLIDTAGPEGSTVLRTLQAVARLNRSVNTERIQTGIAAAKAEGKRPGNPGLRERHPDAIRAVAAARQRAYVGQLGDTASSWLPIVRRLRPQHSWAEVAQVLKHHGQTWTVEKLRRAVHRLVHEKMAEPILLDRSPRRPPEDRQMTLVASLALADPDLSLRGIAAQLERLRERTPRGKKQWAASSVKALLDQARRLGLVVHEPRDDS